MAVHALLAEELVGLAPGGDQRQADQVFVEFACGLEVLRDVGRVMQAGGSFTAVAMIMSSKSARSQNRLVKSSP